MYQHVHGKTDTQALLASLCPFLPHCHPSLPMQPLPAGVIGLIGRQHPVHRGSYLTVTGDIPQTIRPQNEHIVGAVLILCQVIHSYLVGKEGEAGAWG